MKNARRNRTRRTGFLLSLAVVLAALAVPALAQLVDRTTAPNAAGAGIAKSLMDEIGAGRGDWMTPGSSAFIIARDPFRAIRRGRQLFQHGGTISIREFVVGAWNAEMGMQAVDPELTAAATAHARYVTPSGMVLDGALDAIEAPRAKDAADDPDEDGVANEIPTS